MHSQQLYHTFKKIPTKILIFCMNAENLPAQFAQIFEGKSATRHRRAKVRDVRQKSSVF